MSRQTAGAVSARNRARKAVAALAAARAERDKRIENSVTEWHKAADAITKAQAIIDAAHIEQLGALAALESDEVSVEETGLLLGLDEAAARSGRKAAKRLTQAATDTQHTPAWAQPQADAHQGSEEHSHGVQ